MLKLVFLILIALAIIIMSAIMERTRVKSNILHYILLLSLIATLSYIVTMN